MCFSQCCNKVDRNPSPATAGSRATLHRFFSTPENTHVLKTALNALEDKDNKASKKDDNRGEAIKIA